MNECVCCQKKLKEIETFGDITTPMCWDCWSALEWDDTVCYPVRGDLFPVLGTDGLYVFYDERGTYRSEVRR